MMKNLKRIKIAGEVGKVSPPPLNVKGFWIVALLFAALSLGGCAQTLAGLLGQGGTDGKDSGLPDTVLPGTPVAGAADTKSIKAKFGVTQGGKEGVEAVFNELSAYIKKGGLDDDDTVIKTGDWIDLEYGLTVVKDSYGLGGFSYTAQEATRAIMDDGAEKGALCRVIVVGINSFQSNATYAYQGEEPPPAHVVFQFQNIPVKRWMNKPETNEGGYEASEMRKYLVPVEGDGGNFLAGLVSAGVPDGVLWAPARVLAKGQNNTGVATLRDKLWLPTEREMFGKRTYSATSETEQNQARLEYYDTPGWGSLHVKYYLQATADWYWGSSPYFNDSIAFCYDFVGYSNRAVASTPGGVVPAFCVQ